MIKPVSYRGVVFGALTLAFLCAAGAAADDEVTIQMALDQTTIGLNETAMLSVTISSAQQKQLPGPKLPPLEQFDIYSAGSATNLQIINGAVTSSQTYTYVMTPRQEGTFPIRAASAVVNGKRYESNELTLTVVKSASPAQAPAGREAVGTDSNNRDLFLTAQADQRNPYVDEQVTLSVRFFRAIQLLSNPDYTPPQTPGFWTSDMPPQKQYYQTVNGREYLVVEVRTALFPTAPGRLTIGEARVTAAVPDRSRRRNRDPFSLFDDVFQQGANLTVTSTPLAVEVRSLPDEGKPAQFSGGVGTYRMSASVDKTEIEVNEAVTLKVEISGEGNIKSLPEPALPQLDDFRVEKSSSDFKTTNLDDRVGGTKTFEYVLIPRLAGRQTIGSLSLNFFNPSRKKYETVQTEPITLLVKQGQLAAGAEIPYNMVSGQTLNLKETDIRFIKTGGTRFSRRGHVVLTSPLFVVFLALPPVALIGGLLDVRRRRRLAGDIGYARLRRADAVARKRLKRAQQLLAERNESAFYAEISGMVLQYVADKFNLSAQGLTSERMMERLQEKNVSDELRRETAAILQQADFGRFAGGAGVEGGTERLFERVRQVIVGLEEAL